MTVSEIAKNNGFEKVERLGDYKGFVIYQPYNEEPEMTGLPPLIFEKNGKAELKITPENIDILCKFFPDDE